MARRRFFVDSVHDGEAELSGEDAHHLSRVLRVEAGQRFELSDGQSLYLGEIFEAGKNRVRFRILETLPFSEVSVRLTLFAALIKFERFEWIIEKATELGVDAIVPLVAERSEKGLAPAAVKRIDRWRKIAREASQQSRRVRLPLILQPAELGSVVQPSYYLEELPGCRLLMDALPSPAIRKTVRNVGLVVGPEGGWTERERAQLAAQEVAAVSLGSQILRTETAAIAGVALLVQAWQIADAS